MTDLITRTENGHLEINADALKLENYSQEDQVHFLNRAMERILTNQGEALIKAHNVDIEVQVSQWLSIKKSSTTRKNYQLAISDFFRYIKGIGVHPLLITAEHVDRYMITLKSKYSANSIRMKMSSCSSFYSTMKRYGHIKMNPFLGADLPQQEYKKAVKTNQKNNVPVMSSQELEAIKDRIFRKMQNSGNRSCDQKSRKSAHQLFYALHFMSTYGLRAGAIQMIRIERNRFTYTTKGSKSSFREMTEETLQLMGGRSGQIFKGYAIRTMQGSLTRITRELKSNEKIRHAYSCHDLRHFYAVTHYKEHKDIYLLSRVLDHASINITQIYLAGLGIR